MFAAIILVCGLPMNGNPNITDGCALVTGNRPMPTEEVCMTSLEDNLPIIRSQIPKDSFIADVQCVSLSTVS